MARKKKRIPSPLKGGGLEEDDWHENLEQGRRFSVGWVFEYESEKAFKNCRPIWQEIDRIEQSEYPLKTLSFRGVVIDEEDL